MVGIHVVPLMDGPAGESRGKLALFRRAVDDSNDLAIVSLRSNHLPAEPQQGRVMGIPRRYDRPEVVRRRVSRDGGPLPRAAGVRGHSSEDSHARPMENHRAD